MPDKKELIQARLKKAASRMCFKSDVEVEAREQQLAELTKINRHIVDTVAKAPIQLSWLPTKSARSSIFAPIADQHLKGSYTEITFESSWGKVIVSGPPLNIVDEGIFLALLYIIKEQGNPVIKINFKSICELLKISVQGRNYARIKKGIKKLAKTSFDFELKDGSWSVEHILHKAGGKEDYSTIEVDPWFYSKFLQNEITVIDMDFRQSLRGDVAKALYRFLASHRGVQRYHTETLIEALNMNPDQDIKYHRRTLRRAFEQLQNKNFLKFQYKDNLFYEIEILKRTPKVVTCNHQKS